MFTVEAIGLLLTYQWRKNERDIFDVDNTYTGTNTPQLTILSVTDTFDDGNFSVIVKNSAGVVTSDFATLTIRK